MWQLHVPELLPLHDPFLSVTCSSPSICPQKAALSSPLEDLSQPQCYSCAHCMAALGMGNGESTGLEMELCLPPGEREGPLQSPSEMAAHQQHPPLPPALSRKT